MLSKIAFLQNSFLNNIPFKYYDLTRSEFQKLLRRKFLSPKIFSNIIHNIREDKISVLHIIALLLTKKKKHWFVETLSLHLRDSK